MTSVPHWKTGGGRQGKSVLVRAWRMEKSKVRPGGEKRDLYRGLLLRASESADADSLPSLSLSLSLHRTDVLAALEVHRRSPLLAISAFYIVCFLLAHLN